MVSHINRTYSATNGALISEKLPPGYRSASFVNNSGHYLLLRLGGNDGPVDAGSADLTIPPYTAAGVSLTADLVGGRFTDSVGQIAASLATAADGICTASYSPAPISDYMIALPGASQGQSITPVPTGGIWSRSGRLVDFPNAVGGVTNEILPGPATIRYIKISYGEEASAAQSMLVYRALKVTPAVSLELIAEGEINTGAVYAQYLLPVEWGPVSSGAEIVLKSSETMIASSGATIQNVLLYCEYHL